MLLLTKSALLLQNSTDNEISGAGTEAVKVPMPVKSATVDRSKGSASMATVIIDNKSGMYSPDSTGAWNKVLWLNKTIHNHHGLRSRARDSIHGND